MGHPQCDDASTVFFKSSFELNQVCLYALVQCVPIIESDVTSMDEGKPCKGF